MKTFIGMLIMSIIFISCTSVKRTGCTTKPHLHRQIKFKGFL